MSKSIGTLSLYKNKYADSSYKYVRRFQNYQERDSFYDTQPKYTQEQCSFLMENDTVMVDLSYEDARKWNYARFRNESSSEYMYYFISNVVYKAPGVSIIQLDLDNVTTFLFGNYEYEIEGNIERNLNSIIKTSDIQAEDNITSYKAESVELVTDNTISEGFSIAITSDPLIKDIGEEKYTIDNIYSSYYAYLLPSKRISININATTNILETAFSMPLIPNNFTKPTINSPARFILTNNVTSFNNSKSLSTLSLKSFNVSINTLDKIINSFNNNSFTNKQLKIKINTTTENIIKIEKLQETNIKIGQGASFDSYQQPTYNVSRNQAAYESKFKYSFGLGYDNINEIYNEDMVTNKFNPEESIYCNLICKNSSVYYKITTTSNIYYLKTFKNISKNPTTIVPWLLYKGSEKKYNLQYNTVNVPWCTGDFDDLYSDYSYNDTSINANKNFFPTSIDSLFVYFHRQGSRWGKNAINYSSTSEITSILDRDLMNNYSYATGTDTVINLNLTPFTKKGSKAVEVNNYLNITPKSETFSISLDYETGAQENKETYILNDIDTLDSKDKILALYHLPLSNEFNSLYNNGVFTPSPYIKLLNNNNKILMNITNKAPTFTYEKELKTTDKEIYPYGFYSFNYGGVSLPVKTQYIKNNKIVFNFDYDIGPNPSATMWINEDVSYNNGLNKFETITTNIPLFPVATSSWQQYQAYSKAMTDSKRDQSIENDQYNVAMNQLAQKQAGAQFGIGIGQNVVGIGTAFARGGVAGAAVAAVGAIGSTIGSAVNLHYEKERNEAQLDNIQRGIDYTNKQHLINEQVQRQKPSIQINAGNNMSSFLTESNKIKLIKWGLHDTEKDIINDRWNRIGFLLNKYKTSENINGLLFNNDIFDYLKFSENRLYSPSISIGNKQVLETALNTGITFIDKSTEAIESFKNNTEKPLFEITDLPERFTYDQEYILHFKKRTDEYLNIYIEGYEDYLEGFITASIDNNEGTFSITFNSDDPVNSIKIFFKCEEYPEFQYVVTGIPQ